MGLFDNIVQQYQSELSYGKFGTNTPAQQAAAAAALTATQNNSALTSDELAYLDPPLVAASQPTHGPNNTFADVVAGSILAATGAGFAGYGPLAAGGTGDLAAAGSAGSVVGQGGGSLTSSFAGGEGLGDAATAAGGAAFQGADATPLLTSVDGTSAATAGSSGLLNASLIKGGASLAGGLLSAGGSLLGASTVAGAQTSAAQQGLALQQSEFNTQQGNLAPYLTAGSGALTALSAGTAPGGQFNQSFTAQDLSQNLDPGYQFQLQQGAQAVDRSASARGTLLSGGTLKALTQYGQNFANTAYQNAYSRFMETRQNNYSNLATLAGYGQGATGQSAGLAGTATPQQASTLQSGITGAGAATGSGITSSAGALSGALATLGNVGFVGAAGGAGGLNSINGVTDPIQQRVQ